MLSHRYSTSKPPDASRVTYDGSSMPSHPLLASVRERVWQLGLWVDMAQSLLCRNHWQTHWIFRTIVSLRPSFSSVPTGSGSASILQGCTESGAGASCVPSDPIPASPTSGWTDVKWADLGSFSQNHTSGQCGHSPRDSCSSIWSTSPSYQLPSSLGKILKVLECETKRVFPFVPARKHCRGVKFVFPIRLHAARPLPSPSRVRLINGLSSQHNEDQKGVRLLGHSPNSFCRRTTLELLCTIKQRTCGSLIYQVGSEDNYFSSSQYSRCALTAEAEQGSWGIQTLFTFRWNWILELYTKIGKGVSNWDGEEDRLLYRVTDRLI